MMRFDFNQRPFILIWETTRACSLACRHCRASAKLRRHPQELNTAEGKRFIDQVARAHPELFIMTGGDPIQREDLKDLAAYASSLGLRVALSPSATPEFAAADLEELKRCGVARISLSLDGASRETHDRFRGVRGVWDWTMQAIDKARAADLPLQLNTTFTRVNLGEFDQFARLLDTLRPAMWSVFQLVPTGRAKSADLLTGEELENLFERMADLLPSAPCDIKTTEGHHFRRVVLQRTHHVGGLGKRSPMGINDGKGFVFVSHTGEIYPSGFLPLSAGNVRASELINVYRDHPMFRTLRDPDQLQGKCGACEFRTICGGSRARAYAVSGNMMAQEPLCIYQPPAWRKARGQATEAACLPAVAEPQVPALASGSWESGPAAPSTASGAREEPAALSPTSIQPAFVSSPIPSLPTRLSLC